MLTQKYPSYVSVSLDRVVLDARRLNMCMRPVHVLFYDDISTTKVLTSKN